jgi:hypothetical protein
MVGRSRPAQCTSSYSPGALPLNVCCLAINLGASKTVLGRKVPLPLAISDVYFGRRIQPVAATYSLNISPGVWSPNVYLCLQVNVAIGIVT